MAALFVLVHKLCFHIVSRLTSLQSGPPVLLNPERVVPHTEENRYIIVLRNCDDVCVVIKRARTFYGSTNYINDFN